MLRFSTNGGFLAAAIAATLAASSPLARADTLFLKDGRRLEGKVRKTAEGMYVLERRGGLVATYLAEDVDRVVREKLEGFEAPARAARPTTLTGVAPREATAPVQPAVAAARAPTSTAMPLGVATRAAERASAARRVEELSAGLYARDERTREAALKDLSAVPSAAPSLVALASRPGLAPEVQARLFEIVEATPTPDVLPEVERILDDPSTPPSLLAQCLVVATVLDGEEGRVRSTLVRLVRNRADPCPSVRVAAVGALGALAARAEPEIAREISRELACDLATAPPDERRAVADALAGVPHLAPDVLRTVELEARSSSDEGARRAALGVVAAIDPGSSILRAAATRDPSPAVRACAVTAIGAGREGDVDLLVESLKDRDACVVAAAARALLRNAAVRAICPLIEALRTSPGAAASEIQSALVTLTGEQLPPTSVAWSIWWEDQGKKDPRFSSGGGR